MGTLLLPYLNVEKGELQCTDTLNMTDPEKVYDAHYAYLKAGSEWLTTNTFCCEPLSLKDTPWEHTPDILSQRGAELALRAKIAFQTKYPQRKVRVVGAMGPGWLSPEKKEIDEETLGLTYEKWAKGLINAGVDGICLETVQDLMQAQIAVKKVRAIAPTLPIFILMHTVNHKVGQHPLVQAVQKTAELGPNGLGFNCGNGALTAESLVSLQHFKGEVLLKPNTKLPPSAFAEAMKPYQNKMTWWGGCCGTDPEHIEALRDV